MAFVFIVTDTFTSSFTPFEFANEPDANGGEQKPKENVIKRAKTRNDGNGYEGR